MRRALAIATIVASAGCTSPSSGEEPPLTMTPPMTCGNGVLDPSETCDGGALDGMSCAALGLGTGTLSCRADCVGFDASDCEQPDDPDDPDDPACEPQTCTSLGLACGMALDECGGTLDCGTCPRPAGPVRWTAVSAGGEHTCALRDDDSLWCFGRNNFQQVGAGGTPFGHNASPVRLPTANNWIAVTAGHQHSCGLRVDGTAWCWGRNDSGQLGSGTTVSTGTPVQYTEPQDHPYMQIVTGAHHTCALRQGGGLRTCAGATTLGSPDSTPSYTGSFLATIASGGDASCAVTNTAAVRCDVLGDNAQLNSTRTWVDVDVGQSFWCALASGGTLFCQGDGIWGQLGNGAMTSSTTPVQAGSSLSWVSITTGGRHACAITASSTLYCWGANESGQLGDTTTQRRSTPTYVGPGWAAVSAGENHTCGIKLDDSLWCWGEGSYGRLGTNGIADATSPTRVVD